jgi:F-type H+-transporting ATPase subunit b
VRRTILAFLTVAGGLLVAVPQLLAQETKVGNAAEPDLFAWRLINTLIFAAALAWFLKKYAPGFFNARSADIQRAIKEATGLKIQADFRYSEIDKKMATLGEEVKRLREHSAAEMEREHQRMREDARQEIQHIHRNVIAEIDAFRAEGMERIRQHTAQVALQLAERKLRERFESDEPRDMFQDFIHLVEHGKN